MNKGTLAIAHLHRLFCVSVMLRKVRVHNRGKSHNYPQLQLAYLLILAYQRQHRLYPYTMLMNNQTVYNENISEITFSVLSRCVLGDNHRSSFDHLDKMYKLLPYVKQIVDCIADDTGVPNTLNWRKKIPIDSTEVRLTATYFQSVIQLIQTKMFRSYDGTEQGYSQKVKAHEHMVLSTSDLVYKHTIHDDVSVLLASLEKNVSTYFMFEFKDIWSEAKGNNNERDSDSTDLDISDVGEDIHSSDLDMNEFCADDDKSLSSIGQNSGSLSDCSKSSYHTSYSDNEQVEDLNDASLDGSFGGGSQHHLNRSWNAWGTIHNENVLPQRPHARFGRGRRDRSEPGWEDMLKMIERKENQSM